MPYWDAVQRMCVMSWNPGGGCRNLSRVVDESGYHLVMLQEAPATVDLDSKRWSVAADAGQLVAAREPARVTKLVSSFDNEGFRNFAGSQKDRGDQANFAANGRSSGFPSRPPQVEAKPNESLLVRRSPEIYWMAALVEWAPARCEFDRLTALSLHVDHRHARTDVSDSLVGVLRFLDTRGTHVDIVCGDLNSTRCRGVSNV